MSERWDRFACAEPEIVKHAGDFGIRFECYKVGSRPFEEWLHLHTHEFCRFVFCLPQDAFNIREAIRIRELLQEWGASVSEKEFIVRVQDPSLNEVRCGCSDAYELKYFGNFKELYAQNFIERDPVEKIASVLNWQWSVNRDDYLDEEASAKINRRGGVSDVQLKEQADDVRRLWEKASCYCRQSSRASALGGLSFLRLLGIEWSFSDELRDDLRPISAANVGELVKKSRDVMARTEHLRWMAFLFTQGYKTWDLETPRKLSDVVQKVREDIIPNSLAKQTGTFRAHAALIPFDKLPDLDVTLARAVNPKVGNALTSTDFVGTRQPDIGNGRHPSSLQGKDYDMWSILPEAMRIAGIKFFIHSNSGWPVDWLCESKAADEVEKKPSSPVRLWNWITRKTACEISEQEREKIIEKHFENRQNIEVVRRSARWAEEVYKDGAILPDGSSAYPGFLKSSMVESVCHLPDKKYEKGITAFVFDDAISPHMKFGHSNTIVQTRLPYYYNHSNGMILPLYKLPRKIRNEYKKNKGIAARRMRFQSGIFDRLRFHRQPDFAAQVFSFVDDAEQKVERKEKIAVVFRGTVTLMDWAEDVIQCCGLTPPQFRLAADLVRAVCETTDKDIVLVGHSEGGGEVQYALVKNSSRCWTGNRRITGITINSQRLSPRILSELCMDVTDEYAKEHIWNYRTGRDIVSGLKWLGIDLLGSVYTLNRQWMFYGVKAHLIGQFKRVLEKRLREKPCANESPAYDA